jgi:parallel beta-helix repeat protein
MRLEEVHRLLDARKRVPFWLQVGTICLMGLIVCGIGFWGLLIPAEKRKMARVETPASQVQQAPSAPPATQVKQEEQKRQQVTGPQTRAVPAQYETIQAAIDAANVGDTVLVKAGVYQEALRFKEGIELRGENRDTTIVRFPSSPTGVVGQAHYIIPLEIRDCATGTISNIGFVQEKSDERTEQNVWMADAIELFDSSITIENCRAQSEAGAGILISGKKSAPTLVRNECRQSKQCGISFEYGARGKAENNVCEANQYAGIMARGLGTSPELLNNQCRDNELTGILVKQGAQGKAEGNVCEQNKQDGIFVNDSGTSPQLVNNQCRGNAHFGIELYDAQGRAEGNICEKNQWSGIAASGSGAAPELANNQCRSNAKAGIYFDSGANGRAEKNICEGNASSGIIISASSPYLSANRLGNNAQYGLVYGKSSKPTFGAKNAFAGNGKGKALTNATFAN